MNEYKYIEVKSGVNKYYKDSQGDCFFTINGRVSNFQVRNTLAMMGQMKSS